MTKNLTEKQQKFLAALFDEAGGDARLAKKMAGYSDETRLSEVVKPLKDEIMEATKEYMAYVAPKAGKYRYFENELDITNMVSSSFAETTGSLQRTTFISKVGIYDEDKNLIAVASLANPVKKTDERDLTIKLKLDI